MPTLEEREREGGREREREAMEMNARNLSSSATLPRFPKTCKGVFFSRRFAFKLRFRPSALRRSETRRNGAVFDVRIDGEEYESERSPGSLLRRSALAAAAAVLVSVSGCNAQALAESLTVAFPVSKAREVNTVQRTLIEAWGLVRETFIDPTFNHQDWDSKLQQTMVEMFPLKSADAAYNKIRGMLSTLGDPFTKIISPKEYQSFRIGSDGNLQGVGLFINVEPNSGHLIVLSCIEGSPAARAGIHEGDELLEIDGESVAGINSEAAAQKLRGHTGTTVTVKLQSGAEQGSKSGLREVIIPREAIKLSPLSTAVIYHRLHDGHELKTGYVGLSTFSQVLIVKLLP